MDSMEDNIGDVVEENSLIQMC